MNGPLGLPSEKAKVDDPFDVTPPPLPKHDAYGKGDTKVDVPSIKLFAHNVGELVPHIEAAHKYVMQMWRPRAGAFPSGKKLGDDVVVLQNDTTAALAKMKNTLMDLQATMSKVASDYDSTAEANTVTADTMKEKMVDVEAGIAAIAEPSETK